jgi:hypothetical protein
MSVIVTKEMDFQSLGFGQRYAHHASIVEAPATIRSCTGMASPNCSFAANVAPKSKAD